MLVHTGERRDSRRPRVGSYETFSSVHLMESDFSGSSEWCQLQSMKWQHTLNPRVTLSQGRPRG